MDKRGTALNPKRESLDRDYLNRIDSHHHPKEHTILNVFRAPGYDSLVPLSWYKQKKPYLNFYKILLEGD